MKAKPDVDAFLSAGGEVSPQRRRPASQPDAQAQVDPVDEVRKAVLVHLPVSLVNELKRLSLDQSIATGRRVTQQSILEAALREFLQGSKHT